MTSDAVTRATPVRVMRAEWVKFGTLLSNPITMCVAFLLTPGLAVLLVWARSAQSVTPTELLAGASWAQMLVAVLAAVFACTEWSSGTSRVTFLAAPTRWPVLVGKAVVMGVTAFLAGALGAGGALLAGAIGGVDLTGHASLAVRLVVGAGVYLAGIAILAVAIGVIVRDLVAGILTVIGFIWVLPLAITLIPWEPVPHVVPYLPSPAGGLLIAADNPASPLTAWGGGAVLFAWAVAGVLCAALVLGGRDV
ncbi:hypothetical protein [Microbacterium sp.]|uniref:hypothetical protein n=1 Tax=Microbacterium sp. TaxID=51671 RepID=UPI0039E6BF30